MWSKSLYNSIYSNSFDILYMLLDAFLGIEFLLYQLIYYWYISGAICLMSFLAFS